MSAQVHERITIEPDKMDGQPCIRAFASPVVTVLRMVAGGMSIDDIVHEHPVFNPGTFLRR